TGRTGRVKTGVKLAPFWLTTVNSGNTGPQSRIAMPVTCVRVCFWNSWPQALDRLGTAGGVIVGVCWLRITAYAKLAMVNVARANIPSVIFFILSCSYLCRLFLLLFLLRLQGPYPGGHLVFEPHRRLPDRKSTRLNSSHDQTSYAVSSLKKKTK